MSATLKASEMTLRDRFAIAALPLAFEVLSGKSGIDQKSGPRGGSAEAFSYEIADAMLEARKR